MITVKQVVEKGFKFIGRDAIMVGVGNRVEKFVENLEKDINEGGYQENPVYGFAWRGNNFSTPDGVMSGDLLVDVIYENGVVRTDRAVTFLWLAQGDGKIARWRPSMDNWKTKEVPTETPEEKEALDTIETVVNAEPLKNIAMDSKRGLAAIRTLESLGYAWNGGEQWKPPLGEKPKWLETEVDYERLDENTKLSELVAIWEDNELFTLSMEQYKEVFDLDRVIRLHRDGGAWRKIERPVNWDAKAREFLTEHDTGKNVAWSVGGWKLNMEDMVKFCHLVAEYTPKPN